MFLSTTSYPLLDAFWTILEIFLFVLWIWLVIAVYIDVFPKPGPVGFGKGPLGAG